MLRLERSKFGRRCPVIYPKGSVFYNRWNVVILLTLVVVIFTTPYDTAFMPLQVDGVFVLNRCTDTIFTLDLLLNFFVAVPNPQVRGCYITDPWVIAKTYLCSNFLIDAVSVISGPADVYCVMAGEHTFPMLGRLRLLRAVKLSQVAASGHLTEWKVMSGFPNWKLSVVWLAFFLMVCCHWSACLWGGIAFGSKREETWLIALEAAKGGPASFYENGWDIYLLSLYWSVMTIATIGYGDITPQNRIEYYVTLFCMACMAATWTYVIGEICAILSTSSPHQTQFRRNTDDMNWLMNEWDVPQEFRRRVRRFLHEGRDMERHQRNRQIVSLVSPTLQGELTREVNMHWMKEIPYLQDLETDATGQLMQHLMFQMFAPQEEEHFDATLCIVARGTCARRGRVIARMGFWGEDMVLENALLRDEAPTRALSYVELLALKLDDLKQVTEQYPSLKRKVRMAKVWIGARRGVKLVARVLRELEYENALDLSTLTCAEHLLLADGVLCGQVTTLSTAAQLQRRLLGHRGGGRPSTVLREGSSEAAGSMDSFDRAARLPSDAAARHAASGGLLAGTSLGLLNGCPAGALQASGGRQAPSSSSLSMQSGGVQRGGGGAAMEGLRAEAAVLSARINKDLAELLAKAELTLAQP